MADVALSDAGVRVVESIVQATLPVSEDVNAGDPVRIDGESGKFNKSSGKVYGVAVQKQKAGLAVTALRLGVLEGFDFSAQSHGDPLYLSDGGAVADTAGTVEQGLGFVIPATADSPYSKLFAVEVV